MQINEELLNTNKPILHYNNGKYKEKYDDLKRNQFKALRSKVLSSEVVMCHSVIPETVVKLLLYIP